QRESGCHHRLLFPRGPAGKDQHVPVPRGRRLPAVALVEWQVGGFDRMRAHVSDDQFESDVIPDADSRRAGGEPDSRLPTVDLFSPGYAVRPERLSRQGADDGGDAKLDTACGE